MGGGPTHLASSSSTSTIKVLIVDDSQMICQRLFQILGSAADIKVVGIAHDPYDAREKIKRLHPDVLTLDIEMPRMDGLTFLKNLMRLWPLPVVMVSSWTTAGSDVSLEALNLGAVDYLAKPDSQDGYSAADYAHVLQQKIRYAAQIGYQWGQGPSRRDINPTVTNVASNATIGAAESPLPSQRIIAIGSSTGGTEALAQVVERLSPKTPGIVVAQHIPPKFSEQFALRLGRISGLNAMEAQDGQLIERGAIYVAPGDRHLRVKKRNNQYYCDVSSDAPVNRHRPSVDVLFDSVAESVGARAIGVILTGMGSDGAKGLKAMRDAGAHTIAQDEESSLVWGMPGSAVEAGGATSVLSLAAIAGKLSALTVNG